MPNCQDAAWHQTVAVTRAIESMKAGLGRPQPLDGLARAARFSPFHLHRIFREVTAVTPARFLAALRMAEARRLLVHSTMTVGDVSWRVGYESLGTFTTQFGRLVGLSPGRFRRLMRVLRNESVAALLPAAGAATGQPTPLDRSAQSGAPSRARRASGPVLALSGMLGSKALVVGGLCPTGSLPDRPGSWAVATGTGRVRLPGPPDPGEYAAFSVVVPAEVRVIDAFVDDVPGSYFIGVARVRLPAGEPQVRMTLRRPRPTDPPVLAVAPLQWLAETGTALLAS